jgi:long-chain acyl-CoA synthetase
MSDDKTLVEYFAEVTVPKMGDRIFMTQPMGGDKVVTYTFKQVLEEAKKVAGYIEGLQLPPKSQIAIMSKNCAWWIIADLGIWMSGHVSVPVYPTLTAETTKFILEHSESKLLFVGKLDEHPWKEMKNGIPDGIPTISFPLCPEGQCAEKTWKEAFSKATPIATPVKRSLEEMATIIYTSGKTFVGYDCA